MRSTKCRILAATCLLFFIVTDLNAARRSLRIDFGAWGDARSFKFDNAFCPKHYSGSALDDYHYDPNQSLVFQNDVFPDPYTSWMYCQYTPDYEDGMDTFEYLNSEIFPPDEAGLAAKIGTNQDGSVGAVRYTFLNGDPFAESTTGYQWAFYEFPNFITIVALYGDLPVQAGDFSPQIYLETYDPLTTELFWSAAADGFEGQYFCFDGNSGTPEFIGFWNGQYAGTDPAAGCTLDYVPSRDALIALYNSTGGDNWTNNSNWLIGDPCLDDWHGVGCGREGVYCEDPEGEPPQPGGICDAPSLDIMGLHLSDNNLTGTIPAELGKNNFPALLELALNRNRLSGSIPPELGNLSTLERVYLGGNLLSGDIPDELCSLDNISDVFIDGGLQFHVGYNRLTNSGSPLCELQDAGTTQTVAPAGVVITNDEGSAIELSWQAIDYTGETGRYRAWYSTSPDGPYLDGGATTDKTTTSLTISGLEADTTYYIIVRTETDAHSSNPNNLESEDSAVAVRITEKIFFDGFEASSP